MRLKNLNVNAMVKASYLLMFHNLKHSLIRSFHPERSIRPFSTIIPGKKYVRSNWFVLLLSFRIGKVTIWIFKPPKNFKSGKKEKNVAIFKILESSWWIWKASGGYWSYGIPILLWSFHTTIWDNSWFNGEGNKISFKILTCLYGLGMFSNDSIFKI